MVEVIGNDYVFETIDKRQRWHKEKIVRNILNIETTHKHYILTTKNNKKIKLRTDTWHNPRKKNASGKGWHGENQRHSDVQKQVSFDDILREPMITEKEARLLNLLNIQKKSIDLDHKNKIHSNKSYELLFYGAVLDFTREIIGLKDERIELKFHEKLSKRMIGEINLIGKKNVIHIKNGGYNSNIASILHEATHIRQKQNKELEYRNDMLFWKKKPFIELSALQQLSKIAEKNIVNYQKYNELPWEAEAKQNEERYPDFFKSKYCTDIKNKDPNVDFIIENTA